MCLRKLNRVEKATPKKGQNKKKKLENVVNRKRLLSHPHVCSLSSISITHKHTEEKVMQKTKPKNTFLHNSPLLPDLTRWRFVWVFFFFFNLTMRFLSLSAFFRPPSDIQMKSLADSAIGKVEQRKRGPPFLLSQSWSVLNRGRPDSLLPKIY